jgi:hypothetical protein
MRILLLLTALCYVGCASSGSEEDVSFSTVDSNTVEAADTVPAILHLDNPRLDSFPVAMDSPGPTIQPEDTLYREGEQ